jgi:hypothetical protein
MIASVIAAKNKAIGNSQYRASDARAIRLLNCAAGSRKRLPKCEKGRILDSVVTAATSRLAQSGNDLANTMKVLVPVRENARNFINTKFLKPRQVKFTSTFIEPQQRKSHIPAPSPDVPIRPHIIHILRCRLDKSLIYNRSDFFRGRQENPHHRELWMRSVCHAAPLFA